MKSEECISEKKDSGFTCELCGEERALLYWCNTCERLVPEKRCLGCGLKARKVRRRQGCGLEQNPSA